MDAAASRGDGTRSERFLMISKVTCTALNEEIMKMAASTHYGCRSRRMRVSRLVYSCRVAGAADTHGAEAFSFSNVCAPDVLCTTRAA